MEHITIITGAAGGLGKAFVQECARRGHSLVLTDIREDKLSILSGAIQRTFPVSIRHLAADITEPDDRRRLVELLKGENLGMERLVNVAGLDFEGPVESKSSRELGMIVRLNIEGTLLLTRELLELRSPDRPVRVINVASLAGYFPMPVKATYAASKAFVLQFSLALNEELKASGGSATALCPAGLPTYAGFERDIEAQGLMGLITTMNVGPVAAGTLDRSERGHAVYIPGFANRALLAASRFIPAPLISALIASRWKKTYAKSRGVECLSNTGKFAA